MNSSTYLENVWWTLALHADLLRWRSHIWAGSQTSHNFQMFAGAHRSTVLVLRFGFFFNIENHCFMKFLFIKGLFERPSPAQMQKSYQEMRTKWLFDSAGSASVSPGRWYSWQVFKMKSQLKMWLHLLKTCGVFPSLIMQSAHKSNFHLWILSQMSDQITEFSIKDFETFRIVEKWSL